MQGFSNRLGDLAERGGLDEITGDKNLVYDISELLNAMTELSRLANKYNLEGELYHSLGGLGKVLMGNARRDKVVKKTRGLALTNQQQWDRYAQFLQHELDDLQEIVAMDKASQPICSAKPEIPYTNNPTKEKKQEWLQCRCQQ